MLDAVAASLPDAVWAYPAEAYEEFRLSVARWAGADPAQVIPGHGIQALTLSLVAALVEPGDRVVIPRPTYGLYASVCAVAGADVIRVDTDPDALSFDLAALARVAAEVGAKLVFVCDPNNPTGLRIGRRDWDVFVRSLPERCLAVVDEAYADYIEPSQRIDRLADIDAGRPVVVLRTFSKIFGLAGLRLGYLLVPGVAGAASARGPRAVQRQLCGAGGRVGEPASGSTRCRRVAQQAVSARARLVAPLAADGIRTLESHASFVLVDVGGDDVAVCEALARQGWLLRAGSEFGLPGYVRVTIGSEELMDEVGAAVVGAVAAGR